MALSIPDFPRYARSRRDQVIGQAVGLPATMALFAFIGAAVTNATLVIFGTRIADPVALLARIGGPFMIMLSMAGLIVATLTTNIAANIVAPANAFSNIAPHKITFKQGAMITAIIGIVMLPWRLYNNAAAYIFTWLIGYGALLGPVAGIMIADYFVVRRGELVVTDLYTRRGTYGYARGFHWIADAALLEATKCLFCHDAPCTIACPTHIDVPAIIKKIASGNLRGSARVILDANPFGHSCARACPVEVLCEGACVLNHRDEQPIKIALLQRHATDVVLERKLRLFEPGPNTGKRVAIVGAGPAGPACARDLRRHGHAVTVFEAQPQPGGLNTYGIAEYKLKADVALAEVHDILDLGVELKTGVTVASLEPLLASYDAVFVGIG